ncbi:MAG TPA: DUF5990 family protein [Blastocatellia bacterium]|nr:DUF5990 family protein [Blastocatellia bacterium]
MAPRAELELTVDVVCRDLPGITCSTRSGGVLTTVARVHLGIQRGEEVLDVTPADRAEVVFHPTFRVAELAGGATGFYGPFAKGTPTERFFYLSWLSREKNGCLAMFRRAKIHLSHLAWSVVEPAVRAGRPIRVELSMTDKKGEPLCASVRPGVARWIV